MDRGIGLRRDEQLSRDGLDVLGEGRRAGDKNNWKIVCMGFVRSNAWA